MLPSILDQERDVPWLEYVQENLGDTIFCPEKDVVDFALELPSYPDLTPTRMRQGCPRL